SFVDANTGTVVGEYGTIVRTTDGGNSWTIQANDTTQTLWAVSFSNVNNGAAVGEGGTIVTTTDGGAHWMTQTSGTTLQLRGVSFTDANNGTAVGEGGTILRTTDSGNTVRCFLCRSEYGNSGRRSMRNRRRKHDSQDNRWWQYVDDAGKSGDSLPFRRFVYRCQYRNRCRRWRPDSQNHRRRQQLVASDKRNDKDLIRRFVHGHE